MSLVIKVRHQLRDLGFRPNLREEIETLGVQLTACQFVVVVISLISVVFLFVPFFYLQNIAFMMIFFALSLVCLILGIWFWINRAEICEHPEDVVE